MVKNYSYKHSVKADVSEMLDEWGYSVRDLLNDSALKDSVYQKLYGSDEVTGNASGYYIGELFCNEDLAYIIASDIATVEKAVSASDLGSDDIAQEFLSGNFYLFDRLTRCYVLETEYENILQEIASDTGEKRYHVFFHDCDSVMEFNSRKDAEHYARLNAGTVLDTLTMDIVSSFRNVSED